MTPITLADIEAAQTQITALIEQFKSQPPIALWLPATTLHLMPGERYAGLMLNADGKPAHHLILLPGEAEDLSWQAALDWAKTIGGELPTPPEQALLYANLKTEFTSRWYWSGQESSSSAAWTQNFNDGHQYYDGKSYAFRARAVRRFNA